ncbi:DUF3592 domain-containing protein [Prosthecobacter sp. SYSU 5D2]|uniref:DUF3592 domain-containing protein n=1 Tax=Prosthecobacter sp. SYSU 5D2 TaxID=3134134 RepID=UPI0031FEEFC1
MNARFVSFIPLVVSVVFMWLGWGYYSKAQQSTSWPEAAGKIIESKVVESSRSRSGSSSKRMYKAWVSYEYEVNGQKYRNDQVGFMDGSSSSQNGVAAEVRKYPAGSAVTVYYNPTDPHEACLDRSAGLVPWLMMGGGVLGLLIGGKLLLFGGRIRTRRHIAHM